MRVLFDHCIFQDQRVGGVSKALVEMITHLPSTVEVEIAIKESNNVYLRERDCFGQVVSEKKRTFERFLPGLDFRGKVRLYRTLDKLHIIEDSRRKNREFCVSRINNGDYDVLQPTGYNSYFLPYNNKPFVFIIHDIIPELFPEYFPRDFCDIKERDLLVKKAAHIVVPSYSTKRDVLAWWHLDEQRVSVIPWGAPDITQISFNRQVDFPYVLYVGERDRYKRFRYFVQEASEYLRHYPEIHVVCTGKEFNRTEKEFLFSLGLENRVHSMFVSSEDLFSLYRFAICFVFPSQYEGFGLPILEAMACGCPVVLTNSSSFPEVGGDAAFYFEEYDNGHTNLSEILTELSTMSFDQRDVIAQKSIERANHFSWNETAKKYASVYQSML